MVNTKETEGSVPSETKQTHQEKDSETQEHLTKRSSKEISTNGTQELQERLRTLQSRIDVVRLDFKKQVEGLRMRMEHLNTNLTTIQGDMKIDPNKNQNVHENEVRII